MPKFYFSFLSLLVFCLGWFEGNSQQTARMTTSGYGYLEKLPYDYATNTTKKYPLLIFLHGLGERGNGSPAELQRVKAYGPPYLIENGSSMCFMVNGVEECFIVISPQLPTAWGGWYATILADIFNYILNGSQNYRIDKNRVYLTGLSLGGEGVYTGIGFSTYVPDIFAAGAPVSGFNNANACTIVNRKVPMWGFHGTADGTITYANGIGNFDAMRYCNPPPTAELKWTSYPGLGHDIWTNYAYRTDNNLHTPNLYQWFLTKTKSSPPTADAGPDIFLTLPVNSTVVVGSGTDPGGSIASYVWTKQSGGAATLTNDLTSTLSLSNLVAGVYVFRLTVTDNDGNSAYDDVTITVSSSPSLFITNPAPVCSPSTVNLTSAAITSGSTPGLTFTYWMDAAATTPYATPTAATSGTYYIKGTTSAGGSDIKPVVVVVNSIPTLVVNNPAAICAPSTVDITAPSVTSGSSGGLTFTYWINSAATTSLTTPTSVGNGTYYLKATNGSGCFDIKPVNVVVQSQPNLIVTNPPAICSPGSIDLTAPSVTAGSTGGVTYSYWTNAAGTTPLANASLVSSSGTYYIKATNASSCFSINPVTVTINPTASVVIINPSAVCSPSTINLTSASITTGSTSGLTYSYWTDAAATSPLSNPASVSSSGTYYIKGSNAGCFDIKPVVVTVSASPTLVTTNPSAICQPGTIDLTLPSITTGSATGLTLSYWTNVAATIALSNPASITTSGTYFIKANDASVCSSIKPVTVTINPAASVIITNPTTACSPATVDLTSPAITSGSSVGMTFSYWQDAAATTPLVNPSTVTASGSYYIKGSFAACSDIKQVVVTIASPPTLATNNPAPVCQPSSIDLTTAAITAGSTSGLNFSYWTNSTGTLSLANPSSVTTSGVYYIKGTAPNGCSDIKAVTTTINLSPIAVANPLTGSICSGQTTNIQLSTSVPIPGGVNYTWTSTLLSGNVSGHASGNGSQIAQALTSSNAGKVGYSIIPTAISSNCVGPTINAEVTVTQIPDVLINSGATSQVICNGCTTNLILTNPNATPGVTFSWTVNTVTGTVSGATAGTGASIVQSLTKTTITGTVRYIVTPQIGSCIGTPGSIDVRINNPPTANAGPDQVIVLPINNTTLNGSGSDADGSVTSYSWAKVSGPNTFTILNATTATPALSDLVTGVYQFRLIIQDNDGAIGTDEVIITVNPKANLAPIVSAGPDINLQLPANSVDITGTATDPDGTIQSINWKQVSGSLAVFTTSNQTIQISNLIEGNYTFQFSATDDGGKTSTDDVNVLVSPNDFRFSGLRKKFITPNGDTENEFWVLDQDTQKFATCKLTILNSDGAKVYETVGYQNDWNGTQDGKPLPQNVYYYLLDCNGVKDTGSITIIR